LEKWRPRLATDIDEVHPERVLMGYCFSCAMVCDGSERNSSCSEMAVLVPEKKARRTIGAGKASQRLNGNEGNA
jgi:hypothetical protein